VPRLCGDKLSAGRQLKVHTGVRAQITPRQRRKDPEDILMQFQKGVALSVWQNSSDEHSQWTRFVLNNNFFGQSDVRDAFYNSNDFWNR
jgi:hypothetical protein